jgi:hypothetical protein
MWTFIKKHKWFLSGIAVIAVVSMLGVNISLQKSDNSPISVGMGQITITVGTVADASAIVDYVCDGTDDNIQLQGALDALPANGGAIQILAGNYDFANGVTVTRALNNVTISGVGRGTYITCDGVTAIFTAGGNNWQIRDLRTDAGGLTMGATTGWSWTNVTINATYYTLRTPADGNITVGTATATTLNAPTGRTATYVVAASDSTAAEKAQADYVCDGVADEVQIQAAIDAAYARVPYTSYGSGGLVQLSEGIFRTAATIVLKSRVSIYGVSGLDSTNIIMANGSNTDGMVFTPSDDHQGWIHLKNFTLDMNKANNPTGKDGIRFEVWGGFFVYDPLLEDVFVKYAVGDGLEVVNAKRLIVRDCFFENNDGNAMKVVSGPVYIYDTLLQNSGICGLDIGSGGNGSVVQGVTVMGSTLYGMFIKTIETTYSGCGVKTSTDHQILVNGTGGVGKNIFNGVTTTNTTGGKKSLYLASPNNTISGCNFDSDIIETSDNNIITSSQFVYWANAGSGTNNQVYGNVGWLGKGEIRTQSGVLTAGNANAWSFAWQNPFTNNTLLIQEVIIDITTAGGTPASLLDVGSAASGTSASSDLLNDVDLNATAVSVSTARNIKLAVKNGATDWITGQILAQNAANLVGKYYIIYMGQ